MIVLKVGGSLFNYAPSLLEAIKDEDVLVVPGGGRFADAVRDVDRDYGLSDDAAHWMAVLAMETYAYYLADKTGCPLSSGIKGTGVRIALPYEILRKDDALPHSWDVTSDTIAAWMARQADARLVKATDVDGIFYEGRLLESVNASFLSTLGETCVDAALPDFLIENRMDAVVVNGLYPERVIGAIKQKPAVATLIKGKSTTTP